MRMPMMNAKNDQDLLGLDKLPPLHRNFWLMRSRTEQIYDAGCGDDAGLAKEIVTDTPLPEVDAIATFADAFCFKD